MCIWYILIWYNVFVHGYKMESNIVPSFVNMSVHSGDTVLHELQGHWAFETVGNWPGIELNARASSAATSEEPAFLSAGPEMVDYSSLAIESLPMH